jgi:hypothetical protein
MARKLAAVKKPLFPYAFAGVPHDVTEAQIEALFGGYNDFPPNWHPITEEDFSHSLFFSYAPVFRDTRQMLPSRAGKEGACVDAVLFFYHDGTGVGIERDYWAGKVNYYAFSVCEHQYREISQAECAKRGIFHGGNCYHVEVCSKCGHINAYDSSD